ncbi:MAG: fused MFS/spermidine synthase [Chitinophagales bacterium]|nr:fused MFS/spermidine synthase [Hyphomicrobiales bacterium]
MKTHKAAPPRRSRRALRGIVTALGIGALASAAIAAPELVEKVESQYNLILIFKRATEYVMTFGYNKSLYTETVFDETDELALPVDYTRHMTLGMAYVEKPIERVLEIGTGGGRTAWYLHKLFPKTEITTVELDPEVVRLAKKYFKVSEQPTFKIVTADGRLALTHSAGSYDVILVDAYRGPFVPFHLLTKEFFEAAKSKLTVGGVMAQNVEPTTMVFDSAIATIKSVFQNVDFYPSAGNVVIVAYDGPKLTREVLMARAEKRQQECKCRYDLTTLVKDRREPDGALKGQVLTDDFAPVETLKAVEKHNQKWVDRTATQ